MTGYRFQPLEGVCGPDDNFRVQSGRDQERGIVGPGNVLHVVVVADESSEDPPVFHRGGVIGS